MIKILIVPFFLLLSLVLAVFYIKPTLDDILAKKTEISAEEKKLAVVDAVSANIVQFNQMIDQEKSGEDFLFQYLPLTMNQEQLIDAFGFLASTKGLYVSDMKINPVAKGTDVEEEVLVPSVSAEGIPIVPKTVYTPKEISFTGTVSGSYENIKTFFSLINHINRYQKMNSFSLEKKKNVPGKEASTEDLEGIFSVTYGFMPHKSLSSPLEEELFTEGKFSLSEMNTLKKLITEVPAIQNVSSGKPNPFK